MPKVFDNKGRLTGIAVAPRNLSAGGASDGQILQYVSSTGLWTPSTALMGCGAYRTTNISVTTTPTAITFDSEFTDVNGLHSTSSNTSRFISSRAKDHRFSFNLNGDCNSATGRYIILALYKNGSIITGTQLSSFVDGNSAGHQMYPKWRVALAAADYLEVFIWTNSGTVTIYSDGATGGGDPYTSAVFEEC